MISKQHRASMERIKVKQQHVVLGGRRGVKRKNKLHDVIQALKYWFFFHLLFFPLHYFYLILFLAGLSLPMVKSDP